MSAALSYAALSNLSMYSTSSDYIPCSGHRPISVDTSLSTIPTSMNLGKRLLIVPTKSLIGEVESNFPLMTNNSLRCGHRVERSYNTSSAFIHVLTVSGPSKSTCRISWEKLNVTLSRWGEGTGRRIVWTSAKKQMGCVSPISTCLKAVNRTREVRSRHEPVSTKVSHCTNHETNKG